MEFYDIIHPVRSCTFTKEAFEELCKPNSVKIKEMSVKLAKNKQLRQYVIVALAIGMTMHSPAVTAFAIAGDPFASIDKVGYQMLKAVQRLGYWACVISALSGVIDYAMNRNIRGKEKAGGSILCFIALYLLPKAFDIVKEMF